MSWTDARVTRLKAMWAEGRSASEIARLLGDVSRNAVIGKLHRLGCTRGAVPSLPDRLEVSRKRSKARPSAQKRAAAVRLSMVSIEKSPEPDPLKVPLTVPRSETRSSAMQRVVSGRKKGKSSASVKRRSVFAPLDGVSPVKLYDLRDAHCRFPVSGEGADTLFCGSPHGGQRPYCATHRAICTSKIKPRDMA